MKCISVLEALRFPIFPLRSLCIEELHLSRWWQKWKWRRITVPKLSVLAARIDADCRSSFLRTYTPLSHTHEGWALIVELRGFTRCPFGSLDHSLPSISLRGSCALRSQRYARCCRVVLQREHLEEEGRRFAWFNVFCLFVRLVGFLSLLSYQSGEIAGKIASTATFKYHIVHTLLSK